MKRKIFLCLAFFVLLFNLTSYAENAKEYIVMLKRDAIMTRGASVALEPVSEEWDIYTVSEDDLSKIDMSKVQYIEEDIVVNLLDYIPSDPKYLYQKPFSDIINLPYAWKYNFFGENVKVGIIDSGVYNNHPDLKNNIVKAVDVLNTGTIYDDTPHGTSVAGIIGAEINNNIGVSGVSQADIYMYKVFRNSKTSVSNIIKGFSAAVNDDGCQVVNMSLGVESVNGNDLSEDMKILKAAIEKATDGGVIVVAAAGNTADKGNPMLYPAGLDNVISVAAIDEDEEYTYFSQYNNMVDVSAPGYMVYTTVENSYGYVNGTSFASPYVAGAAAIVKGINPEIDHDVFETMLKLSSKDAGDTGYDIHYGWGILNIEKLVKLALQTMDNVYIKNIGYDDLNNIASISYYNAKETKEENVEIRLAVYDKNNLLVHFSDAEFLDVDTGKEQSINFDNIEIPEDGYIKVLSFKKDSFMVPAFDVVTYCG